MFRASVAIVAISLLGAGVPVTIPSGPVGSGPPPTCDHELLGRALVADTAALDRWSRSGPSAHAAEGVSIVIWSADSTARIVKVAYLGETGRRNTEWYLLDRRNYVILNEDISYVAPIHPGIPTAVRSRSPSVIYVCDGRPDLQMDTLLAGALSRDLDSLIAGASKH